MKRPSKPSIKIHDSKGYLEQSTICMRLHIHVIFLCSINTAVEFYSILQIICLSTCGRVNRAMVSKMHITRTQSLRPINWSNCQLNNQLAALTRDLASCYEIIRHTNSCSFVSTDICVKKDYIMLVTRCLISQKIFEKKSTESNQQVNQLHYK